MWVDCFLPILRIGSHFFNGVCPPKKPKEMKNGSIEMQEGLICTYLVRVEVCFIL
jgi:hypothetical protein